MLIRKEDNVSRRKKKLCSHGLPGLGSSPMRFLTINCEVLGSPSDLRLSFHFKSLQCVWLQTLKDGSFQTAVQCIEAERVNSVSINCRMFLKIHLCNLNCRLISFIYFKISYVFNFSVLKVGTRVADKASIRGEKRTWMLMRGDICVSQCLGWVVPSPTLIWGKIIFKMIANSSNPLEEKWKDITHFQCSLQQFSLLLAPPPKKKPHVSVLRHPSPKRSLYQ